MKILLDLTSLADNFSGIERYSACIAQELLRHKEHTYCLIFKNGVHELFLESIRQPHVEYRVLKGRDKMLFNQLVLPAAVSRIPADCYLFPAFPVPVLLFKKNMISTIHDICCWDCPETMTWLSKWYFRISFWTEVRKCPAIVVVSDFTRHRVVQRLHYPEQRIWCVGNGVAPMLQNVKYPGDDVLKKYGLPEQYLLSLSTLEPRKNLRLLITAYRSAVLEHNAPMLPLVLAGRKGWKMDSLLQGIEPEVLERIRFTGFVADEDLPTLYSRAKGFVFPSLYEGFGIPPLEAMACGTPVISSDAASLPEVLSDGAWYFKSGNEQELTRLLIRMNNASAEELAPLREKGFQRVQAYSWSAQAEKLLAYLAEADFLKTK